MENVENSRKLKIVFSEFARMAGISDEGKITEVTSLLASLDIDDAIDKILVLLDDLVKKEVLSEREVLEKIGLVIDLNPQKYASADALRKRLEWIRSMNMEHIDMPLKENHALVLEVFDKFNELVGTEFDSFYTGGLMGYLATGHKLERYHGDLDVFINEEQLIKLYKVIQESTEFEFESNLDSKESNGHEFKITYKDTPMSIGLFLFRRFTDGRMALRSYFYKDNDLVVNEQRITAESASIVFPEGNIREHNGFKYRSQSLEAIYQSKRNSRPKDKYDARIIEDAVDMNKVDILDVEKAKTERIDEKSAKDSNIECLAEIVKNNSMLNERKPRNIRDLINDSGPDIGN